ncbi:hypothetical protein NDN08_004967 [Rhodosorus marinus]|uniref:Metallo-beta-lactamase domain-containing protein n=1 Tax=Rhodosorus marinus TaxID=101924 RepID=A0AAV8UIK7_9RHOD|nr:hypothetical protein NDN08_004967 [Rhodosorus marinus]
MVAFTGGIRALPKTRAGSIAGRRRGVVNMRSRLPNNTAGDLYVDSACIDCDVCRWMLPDVFDRDQGQSAVMRQPVGDDMMRKALQAAVACPVGSIRTETPNHLAKAARDDFPIPVHETLVDIYYNGFNSEKSFSANSYLVVDKELGGVMIDSPRYNSALAKSIDKKCGDLGVKYMILTHSDDVADHARWAERFGLTRIMHKNQIRSFNGTNDVEMVLENEGPWKISENLNILFVPGHSNGCIALHDIQNKTIFSGDFYAFSARKGTISGFPAYNHFSWKTQVENMTKVTRMDLKFVLPGHGRRIHFETSEMKEAMFQEFLNTEAKVGR